MKKISILLIISSLFLVIMLCSFKVEAKETDQNEQCLETIEFLFEHKSELEQQYRIRYQENLTIGGLEGYTLIQLIEHNCYGVYIDFTLDNGYILLDFENNIYEIKAGEDLEYLKDVSFAYYHSLDGFLYMDENGLYKSYAPKDGGISTLANGQLANGGDGYIYDINKYMASNHPDATLELNHNAGQLYETYTRCEDVTYYYKSDGTREENCVPVAVFNMLSAWKAIGMIPNVPDKSETKDITNSVSNEPLYPEYGKPGNSYGMTISKNLDSIPVLYYRVRNHAAIYGDYNPTKGMTVDNAKKIINTVLWSYGYDYEITQTKEFTNAAISIHVGRPIFAFIVGSTTYGNHAAAVLCYRRYSEKVKVAWWTETKTYYFIGMDDGMVECTMFLQLSSKLSNEYLYYYPN